MTLPEAHRLLFINCDDLCFNKCLPVVNQIYYHFEQQIKELEAPKTCETCKHYDGSYECNNANSIAWETSNRVYPDDYCKDYEPKDK